MPFIFNDKARSRRSFNEKTTRTNWWILFNPKYYRRYVGGTDDINIIIHQTFRSHVLNFSCETTNKVSFNFFNRNLSSSRTGKYKLVFILKKTNKDSITLISHHTLQKNAIYSLYNKTISSQRVLHLFQIKIFLAVEVIRRNLINN